MIFGFPVEVTTPSAEMIAEMGDNPTGRFVSVGTHQADVHMEAIPTDRRCPFCQEPLFHIKVSGSQFGRIVAGDAEVAYVDPLPPGLRCVACQPCDRYFYEPEPPHAQ